MSMSLTKVLKSILTLETEKEQTVLLRGVFVPHFMLIIDNWGISAVGAFFTTISAMMLEQRFGNETSCNSTLALEELIYSLFLSPCPRD